MQALFGSELSATKSNTAETTKSSDSFLLEDYDDSRQEELMILIEVILAVKVLYDWICLDTRSWLEYRARWGDFEKCKKKL